MRRRTPKPDSRGEYGEFLSAINGKLDAYLREHCAMTDVSGWEGRSHLTHEELVELHKQAKCAWQHQGEWVVSPEHVVVGK